MSEALAPIALVPATQPEALEIIGNVEAKMRAMPQLHIRTEHILHAGMYARTVRLGARVAITSLLIKVPTMLIVHGKCAVFAGEWRELSGYNVLPACAGRKMIYVTEEPTEITMVFRSNATTVEEAEREFTDDPDLLLSRQCNDDIITITGVECQA